MDMAVAVVPEVVLSSLLLINVLAATVGSTLELTGDSNIRFKPPQPHGLCEELIRPSGYPCSEHAIKTKDGYVLALQRVGSHTTNSTLKLGPPVLLQHGLFMAGDAWFLNPVSQSLGFILADHGFDVWVGNVRGTKWSHGHMHLSQRDKGTIMALAAFTQPDVVKLVEAAALLCPISYLYNINAELVRELVSLHVDELLFALGIHQLDLRSGVIIQIVDSFCQNNNKCNNYLTSITGENCCLNYSSVDHFLQYEPHATSSKNLNHLFQMIRKGTFAHYDYGLWKNLKQYGQPKPPAFELSRIPKSLPLWMGYGGKDELADAADFHRMLNELESKPELLYLENYGHVDFLLSPNATEDVYGDMIRFFRSFGKSYAS